MNYHKSHTYAHKLENIITETQKKILRFVTTRTFTIFHKHVISWTKFVLCFKTVHIEFGRSLLFTASIALITLSRFFRPLCVEFDYTLCMRYSWLLDFFCVSKYFKKDFSTVFVGQRFQPTPCWLVTKEVQVCAVRVI